MENDIAFRCRGTLGSAWVTARNNTVYQTSRVFRLEHNVQNVKISGLALGEGIGEVFDNSVVLVNSELIEIMEIAP